MAIPSFTALYSKLLSTNPPPHETKISLILILPYPATTVNAIYTQMLSFQDVLEQLEEKTRELSGAMKVSTA